MAIVKQFFFFSRTSEPLGEWLYYPPIINVEHDNIVTTWLCYQDVILVCVWDNIDSHLPLLIYFEQWNQSQFTWGYIMLI